MTTLQLIDKKVVDSFLLNDAMDRFAAIDKRITLH